MARMPTTMLADLLTPSDLRHFDDDQLTALAEEIRHRIRSTVTMTGGHLSSNLGVVELTLALHRTFDFLSDRLLWDVGHQAYVHKLLTGRQDRFHTIRTKGGLSGFPDPKESPYDIAKVGHSSTAISTGVGIAEGYRLRGQRRKTVVVIGDGAMTGGMSFEALLNAAEHRTDLLVILNDNGNFIDAPVGALHRYLDGIRTGNTFLKLRQRFLSVLKRLPWGDSLEKVAENAEAAAHRLVSPGYLFEDFGFRYFGPVDGHDRQAIETALQRVANLREPILLHVHTKKGGGWEPALADPLTFHGPKGFDPETGEFHPKPPERKTWGGVFTDTLLELATEDDKLVAVTAAMPSGTGLRTFATSFPDRTYDVGICEQHSFGFVQGLTVAGLHPILAHYSTFAQRGYDQLFQELVVQRDLGVVVTLDRAGLVGEDGETHQGLYDLSWARCFPGVVCAAAKDGPELSALLRWAHELRQAESGRPAATLIRYPKEEIPECEWPQEPAPIALGKAEVIQHGEGPLMIWAYGAMVARCFEALAEMGSAGKQVTLVNARFAKPFDGELLQELAQQHQSVITVEDHALPGGFGSVVAETALDLDLGLQVRRLGVRDELVAHAKRSEQLADQGLDVAGIQQAIRQVLGLVKQPIAFAKSG